MWENCTQHNRWVVFVEPVADDFSVSGPLCQAFSAQYVQTWMCCVPESAYSLMARSINPFSGSPFHVATIY